MMKRNISSSITPQSVLATVFSHLLLLCSIGLSLFPVVWMFASSIKSSSEIFSLPPTFISVNPTFENYRRVLLESNIPRAFLNSVFISATTTLSTTLVAILAAYGFSRFHTKGIRLVSNGLLFGQMMPAVVLLIPLFNFYSALRLIDTYQVNIISNMAINTPMAVLTLTAFFRSIPKELDEAAVIDGCTRLGSIFRVIVPLATPGLVTVCIFTFLNTWEEFLFAFNFTNSAKYKTLAIAIKEFKGQFIIDWGGMMSAAVVISLPVLVIFLLCNKYFIKGITAGSVKG